MGGSRKTNIEGEDCLKRQILNCLLIKGGAWLKSVRIRSYSGPHFRAFGLKIERYGVYMVMVGQNKERKSLMNLKYKLYTNVNVKV